MVSLTDKQKFFIKEFIVDFNATQAAIRAGYSPKTARQAGAENLSKPVIRGVIDKAILSRADRVELTGDNVLTELKCIAFGPIGGDINIHSKLRAIELCMKHLGMLDPKNGPAMPTEIRVITGISGAPGSLVLYDEDDVKDDDG